MMNEERFWSIIETAWPTSQQTTALREQAFAGTLEPDNTLESVQKQLLANLTNALNQLDRDDLLTFDRILEQKLYDIDRADIHEYTDGSDDGFLYCRGFIVSMGREYYDTVNADPARAIIDLEFEAFCYHPYHLYKKKYGTPPLSELSRETGSNRVGWDEDL
jgi:hypothetical protein